MDKEQIKSAAFQNAALQSERLRIFGVLGFVAAFIAVTAFRLFVIRTAEDGFAEMNAHALPLGILPCFRPDPPAHLQLHSGNLVVLATDGFFEWENDQVNNSVFREWKGWFGHPETWLLRRSSAGFTVRSPISPTEPSNRMT